jgi:hypothetical protein
MNDARKAIRIIAIIFVAYVLIKVSWRLLLAILIVYGCLKLWKSIKEGGMQDESSEH